MHSVPGLLLQQRRRLPELPLPLLHLPKHTVLPKLCLQPVHALERTVRELRTGDARLLKLHLSQLLRGLRRRLLAH